MVSFKVATYNILADAYIRADWYPHTDASILRPTQRLPALLQRLIDLDIDVLCLQEVEPDVYEFFSMALATHGYAGTYARKRQSRPDGCATFLRAPLHCHSFSTLHYHDQAMGDSDSGHVALIAYCALREVALGIVNTHLRWDKPSARHTEHIGYRQIVELLDTYLPSHPCETWIICGDFNAEPRSDIAHAMGRHGLFDAAHDHGYSTCNSNGKAKRIDYVWHTPNLRAKLLPHSTIGDDTPLPSPTEPSDHLPVAVELWRTESSQSAPSSP